MRTLTLTLALAGCDLIGSSTALTGPYTEVCKHELSGDPIVDASGLFDIDGPLGTPTNLNMGARVTNTGGLTVVGCVASPQTEILDNLVIEIDLALFDEDDTAMDLPIGVEDAGTVHVLTGTITDWAGITGWTDGAFIQFETGMGSFTTIDKDGGALVGTIEVTETDPAGLPMTIDVDLSW